MRRSSFTERIAQFILVLIVIALPWLFGGVEAKVQSWCFVFFAIPLVIWCFDLFRSVNRLPVFPAAILIPFIALGLGFLQVVPFSTGLIQNVSPNTQELRADLSVSSDPDDLDKKNTFSLNPESTRNDIAILALGVIAFSLGARFFNESTASISLCVFVTLNGVVFSVFAIVQYLQWNGMIYWSIPIPEGSGPFGAFINRNNAGGYLNLCLGGSIGTLIWQLSKNGYSPGNHDNRSTVTYSENRAGRKFSSYLKKVDLLTVISLVCSIFIIAGVLCSQSRGACLSLGLGMIIVVFVLIKNHRNQFPLSILCIPILAGLLLVGWVGVSKDVNKRFSLLLNKETLMNTRIPNWLDGIQVLPDYALTGTGLGTYRYIYPMYQNRFDEDWYYHAENEYLETIVELGLPGLAMIVIMVLLLISSLIWLTGISNESRFYGVSIASVFIVTTQLVHSFFDFGLHLPSNLILFSLFSGSILGTASSEASMVSLKRGLPLPRSKMVSVGISTCLVMVCYLGYQYQLNASVTESSIKNVSLSKPYYNHVPEEWDKVISELQKAVDNNPESAELQQALGVSYLRRFRAEAYQVLISKVPNEKEISAQVKEKVWENTSMTIFHAQIHQLDKNGGSEALTQLKNDEYVKANLYPAIESFKKAVKICPLQRMSHLYLAKLSLLQNDEIDEVRQLEIVTRCSPSDTTVFYQVGLLDYAAGRNESVIINWQKSLSLNGRHLKSIKKLATNRFSEVDFIEKILPPSAEMLIGLIQTDYSKPKDIGAKFLLIDRTLDLLEKDEYSSSERYYYKGVISRIQEEYDDAEENYGHALKLQPEQVQWRYEYAQLLKQTGKIGEAYKHARKCVWAKSNNLRYQNLLNEIARIKENNKSAKTN